MFSLLRRSLVPAVALGLAALQTGAAQPRPDLQVGGALDLPLPPFQAARQIRSDLLNVLTTLRGIEGLSLGLDETGWIGLGWRTEAGDHDWLTGLAWDVLSLPGPPPGVRGTVDLAFDEVSLMVEGAREIDLVGLGGGGRQWQLGLAAALESRLDLDLLEMPRGPPLVELVDASLSLPLTLDIGPLGLRADLVQMAWGSETALAFAPERDSLQLWYEAALAGLEVEAGAGARLGADEDTEMHTSVMLSRAFARTGAAITAEAGLDLRPPEASWGPPEGSLRIAAGAGAPLGIGRRLHLGFEYMHRDLLGPDGSGERGFTLRLVL